MNMLAKVFHAVFVKGAVAAWNFVRRHPWLSAALVLFFAALPWLWDKYNTLRNLYAFVLKVVDWFRGKDEDYADVALPVKLLRWSVLVLIWLVIPGSSFLFLLLFSSATIGRARDYSLNASVSTEEQT